MVRVLAFVLATTALAGCAAHQAAAPPPTVEPVAAPAPAVALAAKPQYGTVGFDVPGMEGSVVPGDNFYQFSNGTWA